MHSKAIEAGARAICKEAYGHLRGYAGRESKYARHAQACIAAYLAAIEAEGPKLVDDWWHPKHYGPSWRDSPAVKAAIECFEAEGFVMVPVEPTPDMLAAGAVGSGEDCEAVGHGAWEAMLSARPNVKG